MRIISSIRSALFVLVLLAMSAAAYASAFSDVTPG